MLNHGATEGKADLTVVNRNSTTQSVLLGNGDGTFKAARSYTVGTTGSSTLVGDFNGDGVPDIATPVQSNNNVAVLLDQITQTVTATLNTPNVPAGAAIAHEVDAVYPGEIYFSESTSNLLSLTGTPITTATLLSANPSSSTYGQQVVLSATLSPYTLGGYTTNNELITFLNGSTVLGTSKLSSGIATLNVTSLPAGTDSLTASFNLGSPTDANFLRSTSSPINFVVTKTTPVITWANPADITYGTALGNAQLNATAVSGSFSYSPGTGSILSAGPHTLTVTFTPTDTTDYTTATASVRIVVDQRNLTVSANNATRAYGAPDPTFTAAFTGFVNGDTQATAVTGSASLTSTDTALSPVGIYPITAAAGNLAARNYTFTYALGTLTITQATASFYTITWPKQSIVYGTAIGGPTGIKASASIPGSFTYIPAGVLQVGPAVAVTATFTPPTPPTTPDRPPLPRSPSPPPPSPSPPTTPPAHTEARILPSPAPSPVRWTAIPSPKSSPTLQARSLSQDSIQSFLPRPEPM
ncbi:MBG domain-containing protein [Tunturiibacter lichenicola]